MRGRGFKVMGEGFEIFPLTSLYVIEGPGNSCEEDVISKTLRGKIILVTNLGAHDNIYYYITFFLCYYTFFGGFIAFSHKSF